MTQTSFWTASVTFSEPGIAESDNPSLWDNPEGIPAPPSDEHVSPLAPRRAEMAHFIPRENDSLNPSPSGPLSYTDPIQYQVRKTGYYCVGKLIFSDTPKVASYPPF